MIANAAKTACTIDMSDSQVRPGDHSVVDAERLEQFQKLIEQKDRGVDQTSPLQALHAGA